MRKGHHAYLCSLVVTHSGTKVAVSKKFILGEGFGGRLSR